MAGIGDVTYLTSVVQVRERGKSELVGRRRRFLAELEGETDRRALSTGALKSSAQPTRLRRDTLEKDAAHPLYHREEEGEDSDMMVLIGGERRSSFSVLFESTHARRERRARERARAAEASRKGKGGRAGGWSSPLRLLREVFNARDEEEARASKPCETNGRTGGSKTGSSSNRRRHSGNNPSKSTLSSSCGESSHSHGSDSGGAGGQKRLYSDEDERYQRQRRRGGGFMQATLDSLDQMLAIGGTAEVELQDLSAPQEVAAFRTPPHMWRVFPTRFRAPPRPRVHVSFADDDSAPSPLPSPRVRQNSLTTWELNSAQAVFWTVFRTIGTYLADPERPLAVLRRATHTRVEERLLESFRLQPFAAAAYTRGLIVAGLSNFAFQLHHLYKWQFVAVGEEGLQVWRNVICVWLMLQISVHCLQLPLRARLYRACVDMSRAPDQREATDMLHQMVQSAPWFVNQFLGTLWLFMTVLGTLFYFLVPLGTRLNADVISICSTNLLSFAMRAILGIMFHVSGSSEVGGPEDRRRRGLSSYDLDKIPRFVFSHTEEVSTPNCAICLSDFHRGELLASLPCDQRHCFHDTCIRAWLERTNACPLCQKEL